MKPVAPWFGNMLTAAIGLTLADCAGMRFLFGMALGLSLVIVLLRFAENMNEI